MPSEGDGRGESCRSVGGGEGPRGWPRSEALGEMGNASRLASRMWRPIARVGHRGHVGNTRGALYTGATPSRARAASRAFAAAEGDRSSPTAGLRRHDPAKDGILRVRGREPGTHVVVARALKKGLLDSELASGGFRLEPPSFLFTSAHAHELRSLHYSKSSPDDLGCSVCAAKLAQGEGFTCQTCGFNLCLRCALPHRHADDASPSKRPPPPPTEASVAVDVGRGGCGCPTISGSWATRRRFWMNPCHC